MEVSYLLDYLLVLNLFMLVEHLKTMHFVNAPGCYAWMGGEYDSIEQIRANGGTTIIDGALFNHVTPTILYTQFQSETYIVNVTCPNATSIKLGIDNINSTCYIYSPLDTSGWTITGTGAIYTDYYETITDAITASADGDIVQVMDGTYDENVVINKAIKLIGNDKRKMLLSMLIILIRW